MDKPVNPLTAQDIQTLKDLQGKIATAKQHIELAKKAGLDMSDAERLLIEMEDKQKKLLLVYGNPSNFK